jgi:hypothetical protein
VSQRIKGQEVAIIITQDGDVQNTLVDIHNFDIEFSSEIKTVGYLGQKTDTNDDVYHGVKFNLEMHTFTQDWLRFLVAMHDRQKRNNPTTVFNIAAALFYPGGDEPQIFIPDAKFGPVNMTVPNRTDYVNKKISGASDDYDLALS